MPWTLAITPVWPTLEGPHDAYDLTLTKQGKTVYHRRQSGAEWLSGHWVMVDFASHFQRASHLFDIEPAYTIKDNCEIVNSYKPRSTHADAYWLEVVLMGVRLASGVNKVSLACFLRVDPDPETGIERFIVARFNSLLEDCEQFGATSRAECEAAESQRKELGLSSEEDNSEVDVTSA